MKNSQKGFVVPILIIIAVLAIGGGVYYYSREAKTSQSQNVNGNTNLSVKSVSNSTNKYTDLSGLFSFMYPEDWGIEKTLDTVNFFDRNSLRETPKTQTTQQSVLVNPLKSEPTYDSIIYVGVDRRANALAENEKQLTYLGSLPNHSYTKGDVSIGGQNGYKVSYNETTAKSVQYFVPLKYNGTTVLFFATIVSRNGSQDWLMKGSSAIESISFDTTKVSQFVEQAGNTAQDNEVKSTIAGLRPGAELYLDSHTDYSEICKSTGTVFTKTLNELKEKVGNNISCMDGKNYAVTVKLTTGEFYCVDSTGYLNKASRFNSQNICQK